MNFTDKVVLISGATGGLGEALAHQLTIEHCKLALCGRREDQLQIIAQHIKQNHEECITKRCDVTNPQDVHEMIDYTMKQYHRIDIAILTAGILIPNPIETLTSKIAIKTMETNFFGTLYFIEDVLPIMKTQKQGTIAVVSTLPDRRGVAGWGAYGASKAAISWFLESLRAEAKQKYNINIITIKPGSVQTPMIQDYHRHGALSPEQAADYIISGMKKGKKIIQFPFSQVMMIRLTDLFPVSAYDSIPLKLQKGDDYPQEEEKMK